MKKLSLLWIFILFSGLYSYAQEQNILKGNILINAGVGFGGTYGVSSVYTAQTPALGLSVDLGVLDGYGPGTITAGLYFGYKSLSYRYNYDNNYYWEYQWQYLIGGFRATYYWTLKNKHFDLYGGALLSFMYEKFSEKYNEPGYTSSYINDDSTSPLWLSVFGGARYNFNDRFAAYAELGYGISYLTLGLSIKL